MIVYDRTADWWHFAFDWSSSEESLSIQRVTLSIFYYRELFNAVAQAHFKADEQSESALK